MAAATIPGGSRFVERMPTVVATCRRRDIDVLDDLTGCYQAHPDGRPAPSLLPVSVPPKWAAWTEY
jgi:transposase